MITQFLFGLYFLVSFTSAASLFQNHEYTKDDQITVYVNSLTSSKTQILLDYYSLPVCQPAKIEKLKQNIGSVLSGEEFTNTPFTFHMLKDVTYPEIVCKKSLTQEDINVYTQRIKEEYNVQWMIDDLPAASIAYASDNTDNFWYEDTYQIGYFNEESQYVVYNHLAFTILYHKSKDNKYRIVGVRVDPASIDYVENDGKLMARSRTSHAILDQPKELIYTYCVKFVESDIDYGSRWDIYLKNTAQQGVHWFSLVNSLLMALFLSTIVGIIIIRTLSRDINNYNSLTESDRLDTIEESGWKLIHGDVFRPPYQPDMFAALVGVGAQVFWTLIMVVGLSAIGILSPQYRGSIMSAAVILFVVLGFIAGYSSARLNYYFGGKNRQGVILFVGVIMPACIFALTTFMNVIWYFLDSPQFIHIMSHIKLLLLWLCVSLPLVYLGSFIGYKVPKYHMPVRTNHIERQIPPAPWYLHPFVTCCVGGCIPFAAIFLEMYVMLSSVLLHQTYAVFGFLLAIFALTVITTAEISIVLCYFQVGCEDYNWWWRSFTNTGCTAIFVFLFAIYYMWNIGITKIASIVVYLCLVIIGCLALFLACGSIGFYTCFWFTRKIYGSLKVD